MEQKQNSFEKVSKLFWNCLLSVYFQHTDTFT